MYNIVKVKISMYI